MNSNGWLNQDNRGLLGHGKIYLSKGGKRHILPDVTFSNDDFNWYDSTGVTHAMTEKFQGRRYSFAFGITEMDKLGRKTDVEISLLSPLLVGEKKPVDWEGIPKSKEFETRFGMECGVFENGQDPYIKECLKAAVSTVVAFTFPGRCLKEAEPYISLILFTLYIDNIFDNDKILKNRFKFEEMLTIKNKLLEVLRGKRKPFEQKINFEFPQLNYLCQALQKVREAAIKTAASQEMCDRFFKETERYLDAVVLNASSEWVRQKTNSSSKIHQRIHSHLRRPESGIPPTLMMQAINYGNNLSNDIYNSILFQYYLNLVVDQMVIVNDLLSFKIEILNNEKCNDIYINHNENNMELCEAMELCILNANQRTADVIDLGEFLLQIHNNDSELVEAIYLLKSFMVGCLLWYKYAARYHQQDLVFDIVVHLDDTDDVGNNNVSK